MFRHFAKRALKLSEFKNHRVLRSGISNSAALRRYATASAAEEEIGDRRIGAEKFGDLRRRQVKEETEAWEKAVDEYMELTEIMCQKKLAPNLPYFKSLLLGWFEPLRDAIVGDQKGWDKKKVSKCTYEHISTLPPDMAAVVTMHKLMSLLMTSSDAVGSVRVVQAASQIGEAVEQEARLRRFLERTKKSKSDAELQRVGKKVTKLLRNNKVIEASKIVKKQDDSEPWGLDGQIKVGARLVQLLMETAYIHLPVDRIGDVPPDLRPAFTHNLKTVTMVAQKTSRRFGVIECHPLILTGLEKAARHTVIPYMPMLVPPKKWTGYDRGGFLYLPSYVMRTHGARQQSNSLKRTPKKQLEPVFESLNSLGSTKWRVNIRMLDVIDRIWSSGGSLAGLISCSEIPLPIKPETEDESEIRKWRWKVKVAHKNNKQRHAQQCDIELKLAVARKMKGEEGFYYPHNIDFRGRAYPMHSHLSHLGSDLCRGILEFAEGRPLGKSGLQWLKIHLANVYGGGVDKLSFDGRISFAEDHISEIFDSADRPLKGTRWWMEAEDPLQCLATCINLSDALRSPSPESTLSHMPVHQDGSCNGLQHYAALGRDKLGAAVVNLIAGDKPTDVYSGVAARVLDIMRSDAMDNPESNPNALRARSMINQVDRKLVKQTVMTSVYGVTYVGARDQIKKRLKERDAFADDSDLFAAACYAAKTTLTAIGEMFEAARSIMAWLSDCAKVIAIDNHAVQWTTPLGLPVVQPYRKFTRHRVETSLQSISLQRETDNIMPRWQRTAFPANFVHSLDGSHMMMTAVACRKAGLDFAGVHDSYWTHACDVDMMNKILREKFVELYEAPLLENMLENFKKTYPNSDFPLLPEQGDFELTEVLKSPYFFN